MAEIEKNNEINWTFTDLFVWGILQKNRRTGAREISCKEIAEFAGEKEKQIPGLSAKHCLNKNDLLNFYLNYQDYVTYDKGKFTLNEDVSLKDMFTIFDMTLLPIDVYRILAEGEDPQELSK